MKWGIGAAATVGLAWLLLNIFNWDIGGFGDQGGGHGSLPLSSSTPSASIPEIEPIEPPPQSEPDIEPVSTVNSEKSGGPNGIVEVLIDEREYSLRQGEGEDRRWVRTDAETIAAYARQTTGDETGVRIRILRKPSARAAAEEDLIATLREVGLTDSEIDVPEKLVE